MNNVILVNEQGNPIGTEDIFEAHKGDGKLHKAFSAFVFSKDGTKLLIQKRSQEKPLFRGFWANTCCSHPRPEDDNLIKAGERRLKEECGFTTELRTLHSFIYKAEDPEGRGTEYEFDAILIGLADPGTELSPDPAEVEELKWVTLEELEEDMKNHPLSFAPWFHLALRMIQETPHIVE